MDFTRNRDVVNTAIDEQGFVIFFKFDVIS